MNFYMCLACGGSIVDNYQEIINLCGRHFYHLECLEFYKDSIYEQSCIDCISQYLKLIESFNHCHKCNRELPGCPKVFPLCLECSRNLGITPHQERCQICQNIHVFRETYCIECEEIVDLNSLNTNFFYILCRNCIKKRSCVICKLSMETDAGESVLVCRCNHSCHKTCFLKNPEYFNNCNTDIKYYYEKLTEEESKNETNFNCILCRTKTIPEGICFYHYYFCDDCRNSMNFIQFNFQCNCFQCNNLKNMQNEKKQNIIICTHCQCNQIKAKVSKCQNIVLGYECNKDCRNFFNQLLKCFCDYCIEEILENVKCCSLCKKLKLKGSEIKCKSNYFECKNNYFYCEDEINNGDYIAVLSLCKCNYCATRAKILSDKKKTKCCLVCEKHCNRNETCLKKAFVCENCEKNMMAQLIECSCCDKCTQTNYLYHNTYETAKSKCTFCKMEPEWALICDHNQCISCILMNYLKSLLRFIKNYRNKNTADIESIFGINCCVETCKKRCNLSLELFIFKFEYFSEDIIGILKTFSYYFEGIRSEFSICSCGQVIAYTFDTKVGCRCSENSF